MIAVMKWTPRGIRERERKKRAWTRGKASNDETSVSLTIDLLGTIDLSTCPAQHSAYTHFIRVPSFLKKKKKKEKKERRSESTRRA